MVGQGALLGGGGVRVSRFAVDGLGDGEEPVEPDSGGKAGERRGVAGDSPAGTGVAGSGQGGNGYGDGKASSGRSARDDRKRAKAAGKDGKPVRCGWRDRAVSGTVFAAGEGGRRGAGFSGERGMERRFRNDGRRGDEEDFL